MKTISTGGNVAKILVLTPEGVRKLRDAVRMSVIVTGNYTDNIEKNPDRWEVVERVRRERETLYELLRLLAEE